MATVKGRENREVSHRTLSALRVWAEIEGIDFSYGSEEEMPRPPAAGDDDVPI